MLKCTIAIAVAAIILVDAGEAGAQSTPVPAPPPPQPSGRVERAPSAMDTYVGRYNAEALTRNTQGSSASYSNSLAEAQCLLRMGGDRVASLIGGEGTDDETYRDMRRGMLGQYRGCARNPSGRVMPMMLSSAIAEELVRREETRAFEERAMSVNVDEAARFHGDVEGGQVTLSRISRCMAVYSPGLAYKVLQTRVGSDEESAALDALYARTPECGVAQRPKDITSVFQRAAVAQSLYLWSHRSN
jgi:hypothetical protein